MPPSLLVHNPPNTSDCHSEFGCYVSRLHALAVQLLCLNYVRLFKFRPRNFTASCVAFWRKRSFSHSALFNSICDVVCLGAKKEVIWIHTKGYVALMTNKLPVWYSAPVNFPRNAMSARVGSINPKKTIPRFSISGVVCSSPNPAPAKIRSLVGGATKLYFLKKSLNEGFLSVLIHGMKSSQIEQPMSI